MNMPRSSSSQLDDMALGRDPQGVGMDIGQLQDLMQSFNVTAETPRDS